ncbi:FecR family protein [Sphingobium sp. HWE2-09]|uniref:FecR family protein n=1 Tax=Sphingobium sp. HWE2-09 TaxID=3108390 RepID=UPI002DCCFEEA|nr:FecR domain-containing protein [Sphingobium sp. HWE2-09]
MSGERLDPRTAAEWIARLHADGRTADDDQAFRAWIAADAAHAAAFERASDIWALVPGADVVPARAAPPILSRRNMLVACAGTIVAGGGMVAVQSAYAGTGYATGIGEQRRIVLADGSSLLLDTDTRVRAVATADRRTLWLKQGRIALSIAPTAVPFAIDAGNGGFVAGQGRFDIRRDGDDRLAVTALAGRADAAIAGTRRTLAAGERLRSDARGVQVDRPDADSTQAWESGRAVFHDDRLDAVAAEANRYSLTHLAIADPRTSALRVSGMYRMGDNVALGQALAQLLSIPVRTIEDRVLLGG